MNKAKKIMGRIFLILLIMLIILLIVCFFYQRSAQKRDRELLKKDGFVNLVSAGDYDMNINIYGDGKYNVIAMPGSGDAEFPAGMKLFSEYLDDDIRLVVTSRPGYGLSEETKKEITTEYIVESTRTALKNAGIEAPYVLMPHSMSGIYATYWESVYPDEVSGVIFIDSINEADKAEETPAIATVFFRIGQFFGNAGVARVVTDMMGGASEDVYGDYQKDAEALAGVSVTGASDNYYEELTNCPANMKTAWDSIEANDIPKVYISTNFQSVDDAKEYLIYVYGEADEEEAKRRYENELSDEQKDYRQSRSKYIEKLGNCKEINIPGSHFIYEQKPEECAKVIADLIHELD